MDLTPLQKQVLCHLESEGGAVIYVKSHVCELRDDLGMTAHNPHSVLKALKELRQLQYVSSLSSRPLGGGPAKFTYSLTETGKQAVASILHEGVLSSVGV